MQWRAAQDERLRLVGTTATVALLIGRRLTIANVGDSPAFIYSTSGMDEWMVQITSVEWMGFVLVMEFICPANGKPIRGLANDRVSIGMLRSWRGT
jgi:hypothetical protein